MTPEEYADKNEEWANTEFWCRDANLALSHVEKWPYSSVLDLGCGTGRFLQMLSLSGVPYSQIHGVEPNEASLDRARLRVRGSYTTYCHHQTKGLPDKSITVAVCLHVLPQVQEPKTLLREVHRVLKDRGELVVITHNHNHSKFLAPLRRLQGKKDDPTICQNYTESSLQGAILEAGFKSVKSYKFGDWAQLFGLPVGPRPRILALGTK